MNMKGMMLLSFLIFLNGCSHSPIKDEVSNGECVVNSDCVPMGCSSHVCAPQGKEVITTCEYREEYSCLKLTSCGCVNNKCQWDNNVDYVECLEGVTS